MHELSALNEKLRAVRFFIRLALVTTAAGRLIALTFCLASASFLLDRSLRMTQSQRGAVLAACAASIAAFLVLEVIAPLLRGQSDQDVATEIERRWGGPKDLLASAIRMAREGEGTRNELRDMLLHRAQTAASAIEPAAFIRWNTVGRSLLFAYLCIGTAAAFIVTKPHTAGLWAQRNVMLSNADWPRETELKLLAFDAKERFVPRGADTEISARAFGVVPRLASIHLRSKNIKGRQDIAMSRIGPDTFVARLPSLMEDAAFSVTAGDGFIPEHLLTVVARPVVTEASATVQPPAYTGRPAYGEAWESSALKVPQGSSVELALIASKDIASAEMTIDGREKVSMTVAGKRVAKSALRVRKDAALEFMLTDGFGICMAEPLTLELVAQRDMPPQVSLAALGVGERVTPKARIPLRVRTADDYGIARVWLTSALDEPEKRELGELDLFHDARVTESFEAEGALDLEGMSLPERGKVQCVASASDRQTEPSPNIGKSDPLVFRLITERELLADLLVRQQDARRDLEQQIEHERSIIEHLSASEEQRRAWPVLAAEQRAVATGVASCANAYERVLQEMLNNRIMKPPAFDDSMSAIVRPLESLAGPTGELQSMSDLPAASAHGAVSRMALSLAEMESVRGQMWLREAFTQLLGSLEETEQKQRQILSETGKRYADQVESVLNGLN